MPDVSPTPSRPDATRRFTERRSRLIDVASAIINERGVKGLSLAEVGKAIGLSSTSVPYYFPRKEDLAAACFDRALDLLERQVEEAGAQPSPSARVRRLVSLHFASLDDTDRGAAPSVVRLSDLRALEDPLRPILVARYFSIFRHARTFFGAGGEEREKLLQVMRTHVLLENLYNLPIWLRSYDRSEYGRIQSRMVDVLEHGIGAHGTTPALPDASAVALASSAFDEAADPAERFLGVATRLINERGYRGTSVAQISARLHVTKGSFYHHLEAKDDLVLACFERSHAAIRNTLSIASGRGGTYRDQIVSAVSMLLTIQLTDSTPLLRTTALPSLPPDLRRRVIDQSGQIARRFAGLIIDGITEGSMPAVDPLVAGQVLLWTVNAAYELRARAARVPIERAVALYGSILFEGLISAEMPRRR